MKSIPSILFFVILANYGFGQSAPNGCDPFKAGKFSYFDSLNHTIFVTRKAHKQVEINFQTKVKTVLRIEWLDDCRYRITQIWSDSKSKRKGNGSSTVVAITKIIGDHAAYEYTCSCEDVNLQMRNSGIMRKEKD